MPVKIGYALSSEEHAPQTLVDNAARAEAAGFDFLMISDHFHPWIRRTGHSPFVWSVLGAIAGRTERIPIGTGVTCPTIRIHPAIIAHATATTAALLPGRFWFGVGTGEALNEHVTGEPWPEWELRAEMLEEAVDIIRTLWEGGSHSLYGTHYSVVNAEIFDTPSEPVPIHIAASGPRAAALAGRIGDGLIATSNDEELVEAFRVGGGDGKPMFAQHSLVWAESAAKARKTAHEWWPTAAIHGEATQELPVPAHFEQLAKGVTEDQVAEAIVCGPDQSDLIKKIREADRLGFDHVYLHQVGPDQEGFFRWAEQELLPTIGRSHEPASTRS